MSSLFQALQDYLPKGNAWLAKSQPGTNLYEFLLGIVQEFCRVEDLLAASLLYINPSRCTGEWLEAWEAELGLPDACYQGTELSLGERQLHAFRKLVYGNIGTLEGLQEQVALYGFQDTQVDREPEGFVMGDQMGDALWSEVDLYILVVTTPLVQEVSYLGMGSEVGEHLNTCRDDQGLRCLLSRITPAHAQIRYVLP